MTGAKYLAYERMEAAEPTTAVAEPEAETQAAVAPLAEVAAGHVPDESLAQWLARWRRYGDEE